MKIILNYFSIKNGSRQVVGNTWKKFVHNKQLLDLIEVELYRDRTSESSGTTQSLSKMNVQLKKARNDGYLSFWKKSRKNEPLVQYFPFVKKNG